MVTTTAQHSSASDAKYDFNYFANHHVERGRKHNASGKEMLKTHFDFDPSKPVSSPSTNSNGPRQQHHNVKKAPSTKLASDSPFNYSSNNSSNTNNCNNRPMSSSSAYWNNSQKVSDLLRESSQSQPKQLHNPSRKPEKSNIVFEMEGKTTNTNSSRKISQRTQSSISLTDTNNNGSSSNTSSNATASVKANIPQPSIKKIDQSEFSKTDYAKKPLWKSRNKEFTTYKI